MRLKKDVQIYKFLIIRQTTHITPTSVIFNQISGLKKTSNKIFLANLAERKYFFHFMLLEGYDLP